MAQFAVIHIEKRKEISPVLERHITRKEVTYENGKRIEKTWTPDNAEPGRTHLNRELISREFVDPETDRKKNLTISQAVKNRIREAGVMKIRKNQNIALEVILTGSPETMIGLNEEQIDQWAQESLDWAGRQWGKENLVSAVLHLDEKTPHIHLVVVPIVQGVSRRTRTRERELKKKGIKVPGGTRNSDVNRLCANDLVTRPLLSSYHTSYAKEVGAKYGLERGVWAEPGSRKRHQSSIEYNRQLKRQELEEWDMLASLVEDNEDMMNRLDQADVDLQNAQRQLDIINESLAQAEKRKEQVHKELEEEEKFLKEAKDILNEVIRRGRAVEDEIQERESYIQSISSMSFWKLHEQIPEMMKEDLTRILNKRYKGEVMEFERVEQPIGENSIRERFIQLKVATEDGSTFQLMVRERDASVWYKGKQLLLKDGTVSTLPELVDYFYRELTPEGKELFESFFKRPAERKAEEQDPVIGQLEQKFGEISDVTVTVLKTSGKETGKMYHFSARGKELTAVSDHAADEICYCCGRARKGVFYLESWYTLSGKPATSSGNRVYSLEYKRKHGNGRSI